MKFRDFVIVILFIVAIFLVFYGSVNVMSSIPPPVLTIIAGAIGFVIAKFYESINQNKQRIHDKKREVYSKLIKPFVEVIKGKGEVEYQPSKEEVSSMIDAAFDTILFGSDEVVKVYGKLRTAGNDPKMGLKDLGILLKAMRKDLGNNYSSLDEVDILKMFINLNDEEELEYRNRFKKIK